MSVQILSYIALSGALVGYVLLSRDVIRKARQRASESDNPKRVFYTNLFVYLFFIVIFPFLGMVSFLFDALMGSFIVGGMIAGSNLYLFYKLLRFALNKVGKFKNPYEIEPEKPEVVVFKEPEISINVRLLNRHMEVIAPTGKGKTSGVAAPIIGQMLRKGAGVMYVDPKGENDSILALIEELRGLGRFPEDFWYFDPVKPRFSMSYNPLYSGIRYRNPHHLAVMIIATMPRVGGTATFYEKVQQEFTRAMTRLLSLIPATGKMANFIDLYSIIAYLPKSIEYLIQKYESSLKGEEKDELAHLWISTIHNEAKRNKDFRSYLRGLQQHLSLYAFTFEPRILNSYSPDIVISEGFKKSKLIYFCLRALDFPSGESLDIGKMLLLDIQTYAAFKQRVGLRRTIPDMVIIDEAHNVVVPEFQRVFEMARSAGIGIVLIHQSIQQFEEIQRGMFQNIFNNCSVKLVLGADDPETAKYLSEFFGQELRYFVNVSRGGENPFKKPIDAVLPHWQEIAMQRYDYKIRPEEIRALPVGEGVLAVSGEEAKFGVKGKLFYYAKPARGSLDHYLYPVKSSGMEWMDPDRGLCLLKELKEAYGLPEDVEETERAVRERRSEIEERYAEEVLNKHGIGDQGGSDMDVLSFLVD